MKKETRKFVQKVWGREEWLVNGEYCGKLLLVEPNAMCSYHLHRDKRETFYCLGGWMWLIIEGKEMGMSHSASPRTIEPGEKHKFWAGEQGALIIEISTHHEDDDVERFEDSVKGTGWEYAEWKGEMIEEELDEWLLKIENAKYYKDKLAVLREMVDGMAGTERV